MLSPTVNSTTLSSAYSSKISIYCSGGATGVSGVDGVAGVSSVFGVTGETHSTPSVIIPNEQIQYSLASCTYRGAMSS